MWEAIPEYHRIYTLRLPDPRANAYVAPRRTGRLSGPSSLSPHTCDLGPERLHPGPCWVVARVPCVRRPGDGPSKPAHCGTRNSTAKARSEQGKRWLGLRALAEYHAPRSSVSYLRLTFCVAKCMGTAETLFNHISVRSS
jgi:hypothetical protein